MSIENLFFPTIADGEDKSCPLKNCIRKNYRHMRKWAKRTDTDCFRIYNYDIKEFPLAIDFYAGRFRVHYYSQSRDTDQAPEDLQQRANAAIYALFEAQEDSIYWCTRIRRTRTQQYEKNEERNGQRENFFVGHEYGIKFRINLTNYLDTGLFLDHRETRQLVAKACKGKRLLNLFAYTCAFSVQAAAAGAASTRSIDLSNTYTSWGKENFKLNDIDLNSHDIARADCLTFLEDELDTDNTYDVIVIDPPTLSRSKKMQQMFDVQLDYPDLIHSALELLVDGGHIFFSTNSKRFLFDKSLFQACQIEEITHKTIPQDFRNKKIHHCWKITKRENTNG